jgi:hypothetical protein
MTPSPYRGPRWSYVWLNPCTVHLTPAPACVVCMAGHYASRPRLWFEACMATRWPRLWFWWINRSGSRFRRTVDEAFSQFPRRPKKGDR